MKLLRLEIKDQFRSLQPGFSINFHQSDSILDLDDFQPFCFAGLNGSGKSNVLEALSAIFYHLECCHLSYLPDSFASFFDRKISSPNAYQLDYLIKSRFDDGDEAVLQYHRVRVSKESDQAPRIFVKNIEELDGNDDYVEVQKSANEYLPELLVGYSSGENEILSLPFFKTRFIHFDEYVQVVAKKEEYEKPESSLIYIDSSMSQAVLLANFLLQSEDILAPLKEELEIHDLTQFQIIIKKGITQKVTIRKGGAFSSGFSLEFDTGKDETIEVGLLENVEIDNPYELSIITKLKACATCWFEDSESNQLFLDYFIDSNTKEAFKYHFESPFQLFRAFQILLTLNLYEVPKSLKSDLYQSDSLYVNETVPELPSDKRIFRVKEFYLKKKNLPDPILLKSFSDGEHQFLHTMGICLLIRKKSTLYLLDEPETHFNPDWRSLFISTLKKCLEAGAENNHMLREIILTSHSPFIVSDCRRENVFVFKEGKAENPRINTFGTSVNILTEEIFGKKESISDLSIQELIRIRTRSLNTLEEIQQAKEDSRILGESSEKVLLFRELLLREKEIREKNDSKL